MLEKITASAKKHSTNIIASVVIAVSTALVMVNDSVINGVILGAGFTGAQIVMNKTGSYFLRRRGRVIEQEREQEIEREREFLPPLYVEAQNDIEEGRYVPAIRNVPPSYNDVCGNIEEGQGVGGDVEAQTQTRIEERISSPDDEVLGSRVVEGEDVEMDVPASFVENGVSRACHTPQYRSV